MLLPRLNVLGAGGQVIDDAVAPEASAQPLHRRQRLLRRHRGVIKLGRVAADVADAARLGVMLAEVSPHGLGATDGPVQHGEQLAGLAHLNLFDLFRHRTAVQPTQRPGDVGRAIQGDALGRFAVAPAPADLLPIGLQAARRIGVDDEAHIGLVHPHAEGDGGDHDGALLGQKPLQPPVAFARVHAGVIGDGVGPGVAQRLGHAVAAVAAAAIDHARLAAPFAHQFDDPRVGLGARGAFLALGRQLQVRTRETVDEDPGLLQPQRAQDVVAGAGVGGRRHRDARRVRKPLGQQTQIAIVGTEVVSPLRDTVRLVDGDQTQRQFRQPIHHGPGRQTLGRDIQQVQLAGAGRRPDGRTLVQRHAGIQTGGRHALLFQRLDLIGHQGDQGRDHQAQAGPQDGRDLIADALAAAGRQDGQHIAAGQDLFDHLTLQPPEIGVTPDARQQGPRVVQVRRLHREELGLRGRHP